MKRDYWFVRAPGGYVLPIAWQGLWVMLAVVVIFFVETGVFVFSRVIFDGAIGWIAYFAVVGVTIGLYLLVALATSAPSVIPVDTTVWTKDD